MKEQEAINILEVVRERTDKPTDEISEGLIITALTGAISALEKQIAKKVKIQQWIYTKCDCGYEFSKHHGDGYYSVPYEKKTKYCPNCGQKLDWSEI